MTYVDGWLMTTRANNAEADSVAESVEERNSAKKNVGEADLVRASKRNKRRSFESAILYFSVLGRAFLERR